MSFWFMRHASGQTDKRHTYTLIATLCTSTGNKVKDQESGGSRSGKDKAYR